MNILLAIIAGALAVAGIIYFSRTKKSTTVTNGKGGGGSSKHREKQDNL